MSFQTGNTSLLDFSGPAPPELVMRFVPPPKEEIARYDRLRRPHEQPGGAHIPPTFCDAMTVREQVFVDEQHIPLENEFDEDDARSAHWVVYSTDEPLPIDIPGRNTTGRTERIPVGTIRLVPFPHPPHPKAGGVYVEGKLVSIKGTGNSGDDSSNATDVHDEKPLTGLAAWSFQDRATTCHDGKEPYIKLGRLAVVPSHRKRRLAGALINAAIDWIVRYHTYFNPPNIVVGPDEEKPRWRGLICVHAQKAAVGTWNYNGFVVDEKMGEWTEEGIPHVGMFRRVNIDTEKAVYPPLPQLG